MRAALVTVITSARWSDISNIENAHGGSRSTGPTFLKPARALLVAVVLASSVMPGRAATAPLSGDHRLLFAFVEDGALISKAWFEAGATAARADGGEDFGGSALAAFRYGRDAEAGVRAGLLHRTRDAGEDLYGTTLDDPLNGTGAADLTLYGKYRLLRSPVDLAVGAVVDLPLSSDESGLTSGAVQGRGFAAVRGRLPGGAALVGHAGLANSGDARFGEEVRGRTAAIAGFGALLPLTRIWTFMGEIDYQGAVLDGEKPVSLVIAGLDWRPTDNIAARGGLSAGLSEGAPAVSGILSVAFHF